MGELVCINQHYFSLVIEYIKESYRDVYDRIGVSGGFSIIGLDSYSPMMIFYCWDIDNHPMKVTIDKDLVHMMVSGKRPFGRSVNYMKFTSTRISPLDTVDDLFKSLSESQLVKKKIVPLNYWLNKGN